LALAIAGALLVAPLAVCAQAVQVVDAPVGLRGPLTSWAADKPAATTPASTVAAPAAQARTSPMPAPAPRAAVAELQPSAARAMTTVVATPVPAPAPPERPQIMPTASAPVPRATVAELQPATPRAMTSVVAAPVVRATSPKVPPPAATPPAIAMPATRVEKVATTPVPVADIAVAKPVATVVAPPPSPMPDVAPAIVASASAPRPSRVDVSSPVLAQASRDVVAGKLPPPEPPPKPVRDPAVGAIREQAVSSATATGFALWLDDRAAKDAAALSPAAVSELEVRRMLYKAVEAAARRSPQVAQAEAEWQAAESDIDEAKGTRLPQIDVGTQSRAATFGGSSSNDFRADPALTLNIATPVYDWGRARKTIRSRQELALAARQKYLAEIENSAFQVCGNMVELGKNRVVAQVSEQYVNRLAALVGMLGEIVAVDAGRASELTQAKARLLAAQESKDAADARVRDYELALRKLVGDMPLPLPAGENWQLRPGELGGLLAALPSHPSIQQAAAEASAAELNVGAVRASALPQLDWVINKTTARDAVGREQPWQTMLQLNWAAFRGGSQRAQRAAASQRAVASRQREEQLKLDLEFQVRGAAQDANTFLTRADAYRGLAGETEVVRRAFFEQWYHLGRRTLLDVLIAESDYYGNQVSEVTSRFDGYNAIFRQHAATGSLVSWLRR
jgi:adhesin transport system outer membrane protein